MGAKMYGPLTSVDETIGRICVAHLVNEQLIYMVQHGINEFSPFLFCCLLLSGPSIFTMERYLFHRDPKCGEHLT